MVPGLLSIFFHSCKIKCGSGVGIRLHVSIICHFWSDHCYSNRNILPTDIAIAFSLLFYWLLVMTSAYVYSTDCLINKFLLLALILEYSLPQSWMEWNLCSWSHCPGWRSESEPELDNIRVSNSPGPIRKGYEHDMVVLGDSGLCVVSLYYDDRCLSLCSQCTSSSTHTSITELSVH